MRSARTPRSRQHSHWSAGSGCPRTAACAAAHVCTPAPRGDRGGWAAPGAPRQTCPGRRCGRRGSSRSAAGARTPAPPAAGSAAKGGSTLLSPARHRPGQTPNDCVPATMAALCAHYSQRTWAERQGGTERGRGGHAPPPPPPPRPPVLTNESSQGGEGCRLAGFRAVLIISEACIVDVTILPETPGGRWLPARDRENGL